MVSVLRRSGPAVGLCTAVLVSVSGAVAGLRARASSVAAAAPVSARTAGWLADLDQLAAGLARGEDPDAYKAGRGGFEQRLAQLRIQAATASDDQIAVGVMHASRRSTVCICTAVLTITAM